MAGKKLTRKKARTILSDKEVRGKSLTEAHRGFFGLISGGGTPTRLRKK